MKNYFYITQASCSPFQKDEVYLNLVLEFIPETVYRVARHYCKSKQTIPMLFIKVSVSAAAAAQKQITGCLRRVFRSHAAAAAVLVQLACGAVSSSRIDKAKCWEV